MWLWERISKQLKAPSAGLDPAVHASPFEWHGGIKDVGSRSKSGHGDRRLCGRHGHLQTAVEKAEPDSRGLDPAIGGLAQRLMTARMRVEHGPDELGQ
jgi:hypothetical protein